MKDHFFRISAVLGVLALILVGTIVFLLMQLPAKLQEPAPESIAIVSPDTFVVLKQTPCPTSTPTSSPTATPTPAPTATPTPAPTPTPKGLVGGKYDVFRYEDTPLQEDLVYQSENVSITVTHYTENPYSNRELSYFVADIYIQDISSLRTAAAAGFDKYTAGSIIDISERENALLSINGDYHSASNQTFLFRNGELYRKRTYEDRDVLVLYKDGSIAVFDGESFVPRKLDLTDAWQVWQFGPYLIKKNGDPRTKFPAYDITGLNPRTAFGYYEPGHYCFVVVDGRKAGYSRGISMKDLAQLMVDLGCTQAYNLDGGGSSQMYWNGDLLNQPSGFSVRSIPDIIYLTEPVYDVVTPKTPDPFDYKSPHTTPFPTAPDPS